MNQQIIVCGQPRNGTSMAMRMLEKGGIPITFGASRNTPAILLRYRNPYGVYELADFHDVTQGNFKCVWPRMLERIPKDAKLIRMMRNLDEVYKSWDLVMGKPVADDFKAQVVAMRAKWDEALIGRDVLTLDYDAVCADPLTVANQIASFLPPGTPFDAVAAASGVDKDLYVNRK